MAGKGPEFYENFLQDVGVVVEVTERDPQARCRALLRAVLEYLRTFTSPEIWEEKVESIKRKGQEGLRWRVLAATNEILNRADRRIDIALTMFKIAVDGKTSNKRPREEADGVEDGESAPKIPRLANENTLEPPSAPQIQQIVTLAELPSIKSEFGMLEIFVPGRICLFGEHSDWAGGYRRFNNAIYPGRTIVCGTNQGIFARVRRHPSKLVVTSRDSLGGKIGPWSIPMEHDALLSLARTGGFFSYIAGVAYYMRIHFDIKGLEIDNYSTTIPLKKGLSSSAAICVLAVRAFNRIYDLKLTVRGEMEVAYQGEVLTPSQCGRMDQACAFGNTPVEMTFDGDLMHCTPAAVKVPIYMVVVDLRGAKDTVSILSSLQQGYPNPLDDVQRGIQQLLGPINQDMVDRALRAMAVGDLETLGALMFEAQSKFDQYATAACPSQLTAPLLHKALTHPTLMPHVYGGKGIGSGGDGSAQFVCKNEVSQQEVARIVRDELGMDSLLLTIPATPPPSV